MASALTAALHFTLAEDDAELLKFKVLKQEAEIDFLKRELAELQYKFLKESKKEYKDHLQGQPLLQSYEHCNQAVAVDQSGQAYVDHSPVNGALSEAPATESGRHPADCPSTDPQAFDEQELDGKNGGDAADASLPSGEGSSLYHRPSQLLSRLRDQCHELVKKRPVPFGVPSNSIGNPARIPVGVGQGVPLSRKPLPPRPAGSRSEFSLTLGASRDYEQTAEPGLGLSLGLANSHEASTRCTIGARGDTGAHPRDEDDDLTLRLSQSPVTSSQTSELKERAEELVVSAKRALALPSIPTKPGVNSQAGAPFRPLEGTPEVRSSGETTPEPDEVTSLVQERDTSALGQTDLGGMGPGSFGARGRGAGLSRPKAGRPGGLPLGLQRAPIGQAVSDLDLKSLLTRHSGSLVPGTGGDGRTGNTTESLGRASVTSKLMAALESRKGAGAHAPKDGVRMEDRGPGLSLGQRLRDLNRGLSFRSGGQGAVLATSKVEENVSSQHRESLGRHPGPYLQPSTSFHSTNTAAVLSSHPPRVPFREGVKQEEEIPHEETAPAEVTVDGTVATAVETTSLQATTSDMTVGAGHGRAPSRKPLIGEPAFPSSAFPKGLQKLQQLVHAKGQPLARQLKSEVLLDRLRGAVQTEGTTKLSFSGGPTGLGVKRIIEHYDGQFARKKIKCEADMA